MSKELMLKMIDLGIEIDLNGLQVRTNDSPIFFTIENGMLRTPVGVTPIDVNKIVEIRVTGAQKLDTLTLEQIEVYLEQNGFGIYTL